MVPNFGFATGSSSVAAENDAERMYRACFFFSIQNFSLSDPTIDWSEPRKLLQGCGISPISQVVPVNYFMYGASACVVYRWVPKVFELVDPCVEGTGQNLEAAFPKRQGSKGDRANDEYQQVIWSEKMQTLKAGDADMCWHVVRDTLGAQLVYESCKHYDTSQHIYALARTDGQWFDLRCPKGMLLNTVLWHHVEDKLTYDCMPMTYIGSCYECITPAIVATFEGLMNARISCPSPDMGLQEVTLTNAAFVQSSGSLTIRYRCCYTTTMVVSMNLLQGASLLSTQSRFSRWEGVYCPHVRDESGRLRYEQRVSFMPDSQEKGVLAFDSTLGQWCLYWKNQDTYGCVNSYVAEPLEGQGLRHDDWAALPVEDFAGVYLNAGVRERENQLKQRRLQFTPRPKPTLLTFASEAPLI